MAEFYNSLKIKENTPRRNLLERLLDEAKAKDVPASALEPKPKNTSDLIDRIAKYRELLPAAACSCSLLSLACHSFHSRRNMYHTLHSTTILQVMNANVG